MGAFFFIFSFDIKVAAQPNTLPTIGFDTTVDLHDPENTLYNTLGYPVELPRPVVRPSERPLGSSPTRATSTISEEALRQYLAGKGSLLAPHSAQILESPYWSTIIAICTIEQYGCTRLPGGTNWNLWGIGGASGLRKYLTAEDGIAAIDDLLTRYESRGYDTVEELNGYYVQPASTNWYSVVTRTKVLLEGL